MEECALDMGRKSNNVAVKDAQIWLRKEECVKGMEQKSHYASVKDAQIK